MQYTGENARKLKVATQQVTCEGSGREQLHVFCSAPSFKGVDWGNLPEHRLKLYRRISADLLTAQYVALARMAILTRRPLHLTTVGMGTYNNLPEAFTQALGAALRLSEGTAVEVFIHVFNGNELQRLVNPALKANGYEIADFSRISEEEAPVVTVRKTGH
jgi:hypothetical protein